MSAGPATGRKKIFVLPRGSEPEIEPELLRPAVRGRDVDAYCVRDAELDILLPYTFDAAGHATLIDLSTYPGAARYLGRHRRDLRDRHCVRKWQKAWYDLHDQPSMDLAAATKILVPDVANKNRFAVDCGQFFPLHSAYYLVPRAGVDPFFLVGVLNSVVAAFFVRVFSPVVKDGFNRYRQQFLAEIPIPLVSEEEQRAIADAARDAAAALVTELVAGAFNLTSSDLVQMREVCEARRALTLDPLLDEFRRQVEALRTQAAFARILKKGEIHLGALKTEDIAALMRDETAYYFLMPPRA